MNYGAGAKILSLLISTFRHAESLLMMCESVSPHQTLEKQAARNPYLIRGN